MTPDKVREVLIIYRKKFDELGIPKREYPKDRTPNRAAASINFKNPYYHHLAHCHSTLDQVEILIDENSLDRAFPLLTFIQGILWTAGIYTAEEIENHNRVYGPRDCQKCGSTSKDHEIRDMNEILRVGDIYCKKCGAYVRMWDP